MNTPDTSTFAGIRTGWREVGSVLSRTETCLRIEMSIHWQDGYLSPRAHPALFHIPRPKFVLEELALPGKRM